MIELQQPSNILFPSYLQFIEEMRALGERIWGRQAPDPGESPEQFVAWLRRVETQPDAGWVPETIYWAVEGAEVVGRIALRHELNDQLKEFGGNIGYEVRPSVRRRGVAKEMLRLLLETPRAQSIGRVLLTCAPDNTASNGTILANGGVLEKTVFVQKIQRQTNYYWIDLKIR
jgi:predicted acetyltransferase